MAKAMKREIPTCDIIAADVYENWDILSADGFTEAMAWAQEADYVHMAIPCRSFTKARRSDQYGTVEVVRSEQRPEGWGHPLATEGNDIAKRCVEIAKVVRARGKWWTIENQVRSFLWDIKYIRKLRDGKQVVETVLDQCAYGSEYLKPTRLLGEAPWLSSLRKCCKDVAPHTHVTLQGKVLDYRTSPPELVWRTSLAAEYPEGLCSAWAQAVREALSMQDGAQLPQFVRIKPNVLVRKELVRSAPSTSGAEASGTTPASSS